MSASVGTAQQQLSIGIGRLGSAFFAVVVAVIIAAAVAFGQLAATAKPLAPVGGLQNPDAVDQGAHKTITLPNSFGGWNGPRMTVPDGAGPRLRAE